MAAFQPKRRHLLLLSEAQPKKAVFTPLPKKEKLKQFALNKQQQQIRAWSLILTKKQLFSLRETAM
jgi:hypothetical protein